MTHDDVLELCSVVATDLDEFVRLVDEVLSLTVVRREARVRIERPACHSVAAHSPL